MCPHGWQQQRADELKEHAHAQRSAPNAAPVAPATADACATTSPPAATAAAAAARHASATTANATGFTACTQSTREHRAACNGVTDSGAEGARSCQQGGGAAPAHGAPLSDRIATHRFDGPAPADRCPRGSGALDALAIAARAAGNAFARPRAEAVQVATTVHVRHATRANCQTEEVAGEAPIYYPSST